MTFDDVSQLAVDALEEEFLLISDGAERYLIQQFIIELRMNHRWYYLSPAIVSEHIWHPLRENDTLCHVVMTATINFSLRLSLNYGNSAVDNVIDTLAQQLSRVGHSSIADTTFKEHVPSVAAVKKLLQENLWLVYLILLERDLSRLFVQGLFSPKEGEDE